MQENFRDRYRPALLVLSAALPIVACAVLIPFRTSVENTNAALVLVLLVVAAASTGIRPAGIIAAISSALAFDFFLTAPYNTLAIIDRADVETTILLVLVGVATTEIALWGRRQQGRASREHGYLDGVLGTIGSVAVGDVAPAVLTRAVADQLREILSLDACTFETRLTPPAPARLNHDGTLTRSGRPFDVQHVGLPTDSEVELLVQTAGVVRGRYLLTSATRVRRPTLEQLRVAIALADQVGAALAVAATDTHR
jgi:Domain of unknown function (DUF4118)